MDLSTQYLGFDLPHPLMPGASPLADSLDSVRSLEDAGAAAIVMRSLFEEQLTGEQMATHQAMAEPEESFAEATTYFPAPEEFVLGPDEYLDHLRKVKAAVSIPVIASLNGMTEGGWLEHAKLIEQAGADAVELNVYMVATDPAESAEQIEDRTVAMVQAVKSGIKIPLAVKLSPYYTALPHLAARLTRAGADGLVIFNRFYQPDIDLEELEVVRINLSDSSELLLRLRWLAILSAQVKTSLAVTGGVHTAEDAIKSVMTGAHAVQIVAALLTHGPMTLQAIKQQMIEWLVEHEYESLKQMQGSMNLDHCPDPKAYERANYMQMLQSWRV